MRPIPRSFVRSALCLALVASCASAQDAASDPRNGRASVGEGRQALDEANRPVDPKFLPGWERFCAEQADRGGCDVIMRRIGRKPVIGVLLAPDPKGGVRIAGVTPDGPAAGAGLKTGDRLLRIGGKVIAGDSPEARVDAARALLQAGDEKTPVALTYDRNGRESAVSVTPKLDNRLMVFTADGEMMQPSGNVVIRRFGEGGAPLSAEGVEIDGVAGPMWHHGGGEAQTIVIGPDGEHRTETRVIRIECKDKDDACRKRAAEHMAMGPGDGQDRRIVIRTDCKPGEECRNHLRLADAFRWNGLNLASVDAKLGRYFGTDKGVLVLSTGPALGELQPGDVIQRVDGKDVATPRAVMDALRDKPADSSVPVDYLRDRKPGTVRVKVPKPTTFDLPLPEARRNGAQSPATTTRRSIVMIDRDGQVRRWEDDGEGPMPLPPPPPMPRED
ncbi:MAG: PDZ domain-containing protein [Pseudomonadota bacterium]